MSAESKKFLTLSDLYRYLRENMYECIAIQAPSENQFLPSTSKDENTAETLMALQTPSENQFQPSTSKDENTAESLMALQTPSENHFVPSASKDENTAETLMALQTPCENSFLPSAYKDESTAETARSRSDVVFSAPSSTESSTNGCLSCSSDAEVESESGNTGVVREAVLHGDMRTPNDLPFLTNQDDARGEIQRSGVSGRRTRAFSDTTHLSSVNKQRVEESLRKCRRYMSFPHIVSQDPSSYTTERMPVHKTHCFRKMPHLTLSQPQLHDFSTVSVLALSEGLEKDEELSIGDKASCQPEDEPIPREELVKTWSREETRERSFSEPGPMQWEPDFQRNASTRRLSDPGRMLLVESRDRAVRPARIQMHKKLEKLVEEQLLEVDSGELARARSAASLTSVLGLAECNDTSRDVQEALDERETAEEIVERWTKPASSHNVLRGSSIKDEQDDVTISAVSQGNFSSDGDVLSLTDNGSDRWDFECDDLESSGASLTEARAHQNEALIDSGSDDLESAGASVTEARELQSEALNDSGSDDLESAGASLTEAGAPQSEALNESGSDDLESAGASLTEARAPQSEVHLVLQDKDPNPVSQDTNVEGQLRSSKGTEGGSIGDVSRRYFAEGGSIREESRRHFTEGGSIGEESRRNFTEGGSIGEDSRRHFTKGGSIEEDSRRHITEGSSIGESNRSGDEISFSGDELSSRDFIKTQDEPVELCQDIGSAHVIQTTTLNTKDDTKRHVTRSVDGEVAGRPRTERVYLLRLDYDDVTSVTRAADVERMLEETIDVKARLRNDLSSEKMKVRLLKRETEELRREIYRREEDLKALRGDAHRKQTSLGDALVEVQKKSEQVSDLQELVGGRDKELQELQMKLGKLEDFALQSTEIKGLVAEHSQQFKETTQCSVVKVESQLSRIESALYHLGLKNVSQEHKEEREDANQQGHEQERYLLEAKLKNSEKERVLLEDANQRLVEEVAKLRIMLKGEDDSTCHEARRKCKDTALENMIRLENSNDLLKKELQTVKTQLEATNREVHALQAIDTAVKCKDTALENLIRLENSNDLLKKEFQTVKTQLEATNREVHSLQAIDTDVKCKDTALENLTRLESSNDLLKKELQTVKTKLEATNREVHALQAIDTAVKCKDTALENLTRLESSNDLLKKELQAVKTQLEATNREVHALQAIDTDAKKILLECENRALKAELGYFRERRAKKIGWTLCATLEETQKRARETQRYSAARVSDADKTRLAKRDKNPLSCESSQTDLGMTDESSVCCDFSTECETDGDDDYRGRKLNSRHIRHMDKMLKSAAEKERSLRKCRHSTAIWVKEAKKRIH